MINQKTIINPETKDKKKLFDLLDKQLFKSSDIQEEIKNEVIVIEKTGIAKTNIIKQNIGSSNASKGIKKYNIIPNEFKEEDSYSKSSNTKEILFKLLDQIFGTDDYTQRGLTHRDIRNDCSYDESFIHINTKSVKERDRLRQILIDHKFWVFRSPNYRGLQVQVRVAYFKGDNWNNWD